MSEWKKVTIGEFLFERHGRYKPNDDTVSNLNRIEKIDFSGTFFIGSKVSQTDMILVKKGDFVISGINVAKGAMGIYREDKNVTATIHYSSYTFDEDKIDIDYFEHFLRSSEFCRLLKEQVKGGIKTEIKAKQLLHLEINLPDLGAQREIAKKLQKIESKHQKIAGQNFFRQANLTLLRQQILQDAISGRLTANWRAQNPNTEPASKLLEQIKAEKEKLIAEKKIKKEKPLPKITEHEVPFELPEGWEWCRLGNVGLFERGKSKHRPRNDKKLFHNGDIPFVQTGDVAQSKKTNYQINTCKTYYNETGLKQSRLWDKGTLCITIAANIAETGFLGIDACFPDSVVGFNPLIDECTSKYVQIFIEVSKGNIQEYAPATAQKNINLGIITQLSIPLPPRDEQRAIVAKVEKLMGYITELEGKNANNANYAEMLMQVFLAEAFQT